MITTNLFTGRAVARKLQSKRGQTLVEYSLILGIISVVAISVLIATGKSVKGVYTTINSQLNTAAQGGNGSGGTGGTGGQGNRGG